MGPTLHGWYQPAVQYTALERIKNTACVPGALHAEKATPGRLLQSLGDYRPIAGGYEPRPANHQHHNGDNDPPQLAFKPSYLARWFQ